MTSSPKPSARRKPVKMAGNAPGHATVVNICQRLAPMFLATSKYIGSIASTPLIVTGDRPRLEQVAANLIDNAVKYTEAAGHVEVSLAQQDDRAVIRVSDTGIGIPANEIPRIWDRLFRGDRSRSDGDGSERPAS